jgi:putative endonuclease
MICLCPHFNINLIIPQNNNARMKRGYLYILRCSDGSYYTGSTNNLERRLQEHRSGKGANHTKKHLPVELVYYEEFERVASAFYREKQIQGWSRKKKEALIQNRDNSLPLLSMAYRDLNSDKTNE